MNGHIDLLPNPAIRRREAVIDWLEALGWTITDRMWMQRIPIIAVKGDLVIFVTHHAGTKMMPSVKKQGELHAAAARWVLLHGKVGQSYRWDAANFPAWRRDLNPTFNYTEGSWKKR